MQLGIGGICFIVALILFILAAIPFTEPHSGRLSAIGFAFLAAGHVF